MEKREETLEEIFGEVIYQYTRAQAIADGVLIDLSAIHPALCRAHYKHPVACTAAVWSLIQQAIGCPALHNDLEGVIHDILWMSRKCSIALNDHDQLFRVIITGTGKTRNHRLKIHCGPGDDAEPVLTVMMREED
jgi:hypothetical protein